MYLMTCIDGGKNSCKFYAMLGKEAWYGRLGTSPRSAILKEPMATVKTKKGKKGYATTIPVLIPTSLAPYNQIKFFRLEGVSLVAYGYLNGFYRPLGLSFTDEQVEDIVSKYGSPSTILRPPVSVSVSSQLSWFNRWNDGCVIP